MCFGCFKVVCYVKEGVIEMVGGYGNIRVRSVDER